MVKVLVIGNGGREQALAWKLAQSNHVSEVFIAPGNGGSGKKITNTGINHMDVAKLKKFALDQKVSLTIVGPEIVSAIGLVDTFKTAGLSVFGPTKAAVKIETSKAYAKDLMHKKGIATASYKNFTNASQAKQYTKSRKLPVVIKADGLASGKGVVIAETYKEANQAIDSMMISKSFGEAGNKVVVEDYITGHEVSVHALSDGNNSVIFPASQDHKQVYDNDKGPNTGGMGVIAPLIWVNKTMLKTINKQVVRPALDSLKQNGAPFTGCLYPGLMIDGKDIKVLEFNARFGDPEAEVYMRLLRCDLYLLLKACASGKLDHKLVSWRSGYAVSVVLVSGGYPGKFKTGFPITGIKQAEALSGVVVFHSGTTIKNKQLVTCGGRVLNVTVVGETLNKAIDKAYKAVSLIHFEGMHYRSDIGRRP